MLSPTGAELVGNYIADEILSGGVVTRLKEYVAEAQ
jgi:hypothetical protein